MNTVKVLYVNNVTYLTDAVTLSEDTRGSFVYILMDTGNHINKRGAIEKPYE